MTLDSLLDRCIVTPDGCHIWTGADSGTGRGGNYPKAKIKGKYWYVHRYIWTECKGPIPEGHDVDHICARWSPDPWLNRRCINLGHLQCIDAFDNQRLRHGLVPECPRCGSDSIWSGCHGPSNRLLYVCTGCGMSGRRGKFKEAAFAGVEMVAERLKTH